MMKAVVLLACLFLSAAVVLAAAPVGEEEGVLVLNKDNFDEVLASNTFVLVEFYAPWCGHCKKLAPEYAKAAQALAEKGSEVKLAKVDATVEADLGNRFGVRGYPTLFFFRNGEKGDYKGGRDAASIISWLNKNTVTALPVVSTADELAKITSGRSVVFFSEEKADSDLFALSQSIEGFEFVIANGDLVTAENKGKVFVYAPHLTAPASTERSALDEKFIFVNGYDIVTEYQREDWPRISTLFDYLTITIFDFENADLKASTIATLRAVASDFPSFALTFGDTKTWGSAASNMGATGTKYPTVISVATPRATSAVLKQLVWNEEVDFSEASLRAWFSSILDGSAVPFKKSEALPESNDGPVKILVHKNFDESVVNHNVFVEFYAPWCGHCKSLAPIWDQVGQHFKDAKADVTIAKIDATANFVDPSFGVSGFPTLIFIKADGSRVPYKGGRTFDEIVAFVNEQVPSANANANANTDSHAHDEL